MNQEQILDALQFIDDDMIECVNVLRRYPERHKYLWLNYVAVAACVVLAIFGGFKYFDGNAPMQENSNSNGGTNQMDDAADMFGDAENKLEYADQNTSGDNGNLRDEFAGNTGSSTQNGSFHYSPAYLLITEVNNNDFKAKVLDDDEKRKDLEIGQTVTVVYDKNVKIRGIETLKTGDKVYVYYGVDKENSTQIIAYEIASEDLIS